MADLATYEPIANYTFTGSASNYTFSNIPQTYTDLHIVFRGTMSTFGGIWMRVGNGSVDSGSNYNGIFTYGPGGRNGDGNIYAGNSVNQTEYNAFGWAIGIGVYDSVCTTDMFSYSNTTTYKTIIGRSDSYYYGPQMNAGLWRSTAAINTIYLFATGGTITDGSTFTIYGIKAN